MQYNAELEYRIDLLTDQLGDTTKRKMFGVISYLVNGNIFWGINKECLILPTSIEKAEDLPK